jgi:hypothetical protein
MTKGLCTNQDQNLKLGIRRVHVYILSMPFLLSKSTRSFAFCVTCVVILSRTLMRKAAWLTKEWRRIQYVLEVSKHKEMYLPRVCID